MARDVIVQSQYIANPGCFATAIELGLLPLAASDRLPAEITVFGVTGSTGAGQKPTTDTHFSNRWHNLSNYKVFTHQHLAEIKETLQRAGAKNPFDLAFVPVRGCHTRGIIINTVLRSDDSKAKWVDLYKSYYQSHPFVCMSDEPLYLKQVVNTNYCFIHITQQDRKILITSVIDNLLKGASGRAVQNMNLMPSDRKGLEYESDFRITGNHGTSVKGELFLSYFRI